MIFKHLQLDYIKSKKAINCQLTKPGLNNLKKKKVNQVW